MAGGGEAATGARTRAGPDTPAAAPGTPAAAPDRPVGRILPDPRVVELLVCSTALAGARLAGRLGLPVVVLAGWWQPMGWSWPAGRRGGRSAWPGSG